MKDMLVNKEVITYQDAIADPHAMRYRCPDCGWNGKREDTWLKQINIGFGACGIYCPVCKKIPVVRIIRFVGFGKKEI